MKHQEYILKQREHYLAEHKKNLKEQTDKIQKLFSELNLNL